MLRVGVFETTSLVGSHDAWKSNCFGDGPLAGWDDLKDGWMDF